jgi:hypothetical protein
LLIEKGVGRGAAAQEWSTPEETTDKPESTEDPGKPYYCTVELVSDPPDALSSALGIARRAQK